MVLYSSDFLKNIITIVFLSRFIAFVCRRNPISALLFIWLQKACFHFVCSNLLCYQIWQIHCSPNVGWIFKPGHGDIIDVIFNSHTFHASLWYILVKSAKYDHPGFLKSICLIDNLLETYHMLVVSLGVKVTYLRRFPYAWMYFVQKSMESQ